MKPGNHQHKFSVAPLLHQFALRQIDLARDYITNPAHNADIAVHETRRCLKRLRALLRLVREQVGETIYDRDNTYFRNLGRQLSEMRDRTVIQATLGSLQKKFPETLSANIWKIIRKDLAAAHHSPTRKKALTAVAIKLKIARIRVANWPLAFCEQPELRQALQKTYRKGHRAMEQTLKEPQTENFHEWRKQVNHLRHQLQILRTMKIGEVNESLKLIRALAQTLGRNNDLAILSQSLLRLQPNGRKIEIRTLEQLIQSCQTKYETEAGKLGQHLYQKPCAAIIKSILP